MSQASPQSPSPVESYLGLLRRLAEAGFEAVVIGGCAVGAYARSVGITVVSQDLDLLATPATLQLILEEAGALALSIVKWPEPRTVPVAVFRWEGLEVNILTASDGFSSADVEAQVAREFKVAPSDTFSVLVVDPFDLLRNKLAVRRPKDEVHIDILKAYLEEEMLGHFQSSLNARERLGPVVRYLDILGASTLPPRLARRMLPFARELADFRMLAHRIPPELASTLLACSASEATKAAIKQILSARGQNPPD